MPADKTDKLDSKEEPQKTTFKEFWNISKWVVQLSFKLDAAHTTLYLVASIILDYQDIAYSFILAKIIDILIKTSQSPNPQLSTIYPYLALSLALELILTILRLVSGYSRNALRVTTRPKLNQALYIKMNDLGIQTLEQPQINNSIYRANYYLNDIIPYASDSITFIATLIKTIGSVALVFSFFPLFLPVMLIAAVPYILYDKKFRAVFYKYTYDNTEASRKSYSSSNDLQATNKLQELSITGAFTYMDKKFIDFQTWYTKGWLKLLKKWRLGNDSFGFTADLVRFGASIKIFSNLIAKTISVGDVTFQIRILSSVQDSLMSIFSGLNDLFESSLHIKDAYYLFTMKPLFNDGAEIMPKLEKGPEIRFMDVSFKYPNSEKYVIKNLNLHIKQGEKVAIVGHNGAGKTTLIKLIARIYPVTEGEILINDSNVNELTIKSLYKNMGVLFQDFNMYPQLTVKENIYIGNAEEPINELGIHLAAQAADATEFIEEYPKGFDQILGEKFKGGIRPSTGQWQKLAIARFFYRNAPLVIFDEPTASIDAISEYNIFNKIYDFFKEKTVVIISHRFSTVRNADRIIVLEKGRIIEEGTHDHLMSLNGKYAEAFMLQAEGYAVK